MGNEILESYIVTKKYINKNDYNKINELMDICLKEDNVNLKLELDYKINIKNNYMKSLNDANEFLYYINKDLVAYIGISSFDGISAEINGMVHPRWRRKGIFKKLCYLAIEESKRRNLTNILVLCDDKSKSAKEFIKTINANYSISECGMRRIDKSINEDNIDISLRRANNSDAKEIKNLDMDFFGDFSDEIRLPEDEEKNNKVTYLIKLKDESIGKIKIYRNENTAFISGFGIIPEFRGKGYGKQALKESLNMLNKESIYDISLDVVAENKKALNLYKSCNFEEQSIMNYYKVIE